MRNDHMLYFNECLWKCIDFTRLNVSVAYFETMLLSSLSYRNQFVEIDLNMKRKIVAEKKRVAPEMALTRDEVSVFEDLVINGHDTLPAGRSSTMHEILRHECIPSGLQEYF